MRREYFFAGFFEVGPLSWSSINQGSWKSERHSKESFLCLGNTMNEHQFDLGGLSRVAQTAAVKDGRSEALDLTLLGIRKQHGDGAIMRLGEAAGKLHVESISTGALSLDLALGVGGLPRGRVVEIYGPESSGKTTLALHVIAQAQRNGGIAAMIDVEHALDPVYAGNLGIDIENLLVSQPDSGEAALDIAEALVRSNAVDVIVVDSVAALVPRAEIEGEMGDAHVGLQARLMSQALRKLTGAISRSRAIVIFINQIREKVGVMFGSPETQPGGRALKFYASVRIDVRRIETLKVGTESVGNRTRAKVIKNKVAPPFREAEFDILYGRGISREGDVLDLAVDQNVVSKSGSWYSYGEMRLGQGRDKAKEFLAESVDVLAEIEAKVREAVGLSLNTATNEEGADESDL